MLKAELELALKLTVDLSRPVRAEERPLVEKTLGLVKEVSALKGVHDPVIPLVDAHLKGLPEAKDEPVDLSLSPLQRVERQAIVEGLKEARSLTELALRLGIHRSTLHARVVEYGIKPEFRGRGETDADGSS